MMKNVLFFENTDTAMTPPPHSLVLEDKEGRLWCVSPSCLGVSEYLCTEICTSRQKRFSLVTFVDSPGLVDGDMKYPFDVDEVILWLGGLPLTDLCCRHTVVIKGPLRHLWLLVFWHRVILNSFVLIFIESIMSPVHVHYWHQKELSHGWNKI